MIGPRAFCTDVNRAVVEEVGFGAGVGVAAGPAARTRGIYVENRFTVQLPLSERE
jgi:hypothetical protein